MLLNKLALTLLSIVAVAAALPTISSTNAAIDTDVVKRGSDGLVNVVSQPDTVVDASILNSRGCGVSTDGHQHIGGC